MNYIKDPAINIQLGSWYIASLTERYHGNKVAVMAAYNAGPGKVDRWLKNGTWDGTSQHASQIPFWETRNYVQRVSFYYEKYKQLYNDRYENYLQKQKNHRQN